MKPHRMRMTNELIVEYGLAEHLDVFVSNVHARPLMCVMSHVWLRTVFQQPSSMSCAWHVHVLRNAAAHVN